MEEVIMPPVSFFVSYIFFWSVKILSASFSLPVVLYTIAMLLLILNKKLKTEYIAKLASYFESFYNFCFELDGKIMIKGQINFNN